MKMRKRLPVPRFSLRALLILFVLVGPAILGIQHLWRRAIVSHELSEYRDQLEARVNAWPATLARSVIVGSMKQGRFPVRDGVIVLVRSEAGFGAIVPIAQTATPEAIKYRWYYRLDRNSRLGDEVPNVISGEDTMTCGSGIERISFGRFELGWSGSDKGWGWFYNDDASLNQAMLITGRTSFVGLDPAKEQWQIGFHGDSERPKWTPRLPELTYPAENPSKCEIRVSVSEDGDLGIRGTRFPPDQLEAAQKRLLELKEDILASGSNHAHVLLVPEHPRLNIELPFSDSDSAAHSVVKSIVSFATGKGFSSVVALRAETLADKNERVMLASSETGTAATRDLVAALIARAEFHIANGDVNAGIDDLKQAIEISNQRFPNNENDVAAREILGVREKLAELYESKAAMYAGLEDYVSACKWQHKALDASPSNAKMERTLLEYEKSQETTSKAVEPVLDDLWPMPELQ